MQYNTIWHGRHTRTPQLCADSPWQKPSWRNRGSSLYCQWQHTKLAGVCCAGPERENVCLKALGCKFLTSSFETKLKREKEPYQSVVEANVSLQAGANMVELHDGHFCCCDRQDVLQTWWQGANRLKVNVFTFCVLYIFTLTLQGICKIMGQTIIWPLALLRMACYSSSQMAASWETIIA